jgi:hypothetical protein
MLEPCEITHPHASVNPNSTTFQKEDTKKEQYGRPPLGGQVEGSEMTDFLLCSRRVPSTQVCDFWYPVSAH